jgi:hypothetical protein
MKPGCVFQLYSLHQAYLQSLVELYVYTLNACAFNMYIHTHCCARLYCARLYSSVPIVITHSGMDLVNAATQCAQKWC